MLLVQKDYSKLKKTSNKQNKKFSKEIQSGTLGEKKQIFANIRPGEKLVVFQHSSILGE